MATRSRVLRIGIVGCGRTARVHLERLLAAEGVRVVGCADLKIEAARAMAARLPAVDGEAPAPAFADHREMLEATTPEAVAVFTPHLAHYRPAMDALQANCHVFIERPLSTNVQEAVDITGLARGRGLKVAVGHHYRLLPSLVEARRRIGAGAIGAVRLVTAVVAQPWLAAKGGAEDSWRFDPKIAAGGVLTDPGGHLIDALLWTTGQTAVEAAAVQSRIDGGPDLVTAAAVRLADGTPVTLGVSGVSPVTLFELNYFGENGRLKVTDTTLEEETADAPRRDVPLPGPVGTIDGDFAAALLTDAPLCCCGDEALAAVRLFEAIARSAATGQVVRLG